MHSDKLRTQQISKTEPRYVPFIEKMLDATKYS